MDSSDGTGNEGVRYPKVVLVTGACRFLGGYLTARLAQNPLINRVIAVDAIVPSKDMLRRMGRAEFVRADIRNPFIAKVIRNGDVDTVVHAAAASFAPRSGGGAALKEINVMGAMQLFAACQKAPSVRRVVLKSTSEVYGSSPRDPVMFTEDCTSRRPLREGFPKDSLDIEGYARGLARRRPDVAVTILRLANMIGPAMDTTLSRYLAGPLVPTILGRDARLQLLHEQDALGALERAAMAGKAGTFNIGASGIIMLSQAIRRAGRIPLPVPGFGLWVLDSLRRANRYTEINREQLEYLSYGRVMDTTRMREELGYQPKWTTAEAFDDYVRGRSLTPIVRPELVVSLENRAVAAAQRISGRKPIPWGGGR
ncbi:putative UDP-glucose 4-epimerase GalE2 (galactowaldenase) (UDP-galactose 4-epimerase) (uridine diphosphate galactose 4-epimerase) (uridine diphospho-galactose 4-epimerase) [Mycobacterium tuberculosis H37Rv] [Mycobacterium shimoidei]|uniref:NAD-dependent epimerase/dehydratase domain-containing protein n=1 Tax=Mycobacterium shimoidei TaxID=29313 RepID=A0A375YU60_MYCSH|nr:SDR family oxidoreductase [Mycobacterium shimoidei]SRX92250.1 putative UDP-glucose 4-epimerase GalE2 (galactowaldenase) (UDP-galactose 4-epimerase) (uridine diphosphate galactose 4-epimerase) (uridine diphospho-galactose 4-epimerase) [Mycobacterium tuberculosis H37Rv] [Mycobacterium shimoidei]